jgi:gamma-glutamylputrescine oxidase
MRDYGYAEAEPLDRAGVTALLGTEAYHGGYLDRGAAHLHPLAYALGLAKAAAAAGVRIHETSRVTRITPGDPARVETGAGAVRARFVLLAANGYLGGLAPEVAARVMPINNYIVATEPLGAEAARALIRDNRAVADSRFVVNYFRLTPDHRLLFGGGESYGWRFPPDIAALVRPRMLAIFPQLAEARITHAWGGTLAITVNRMPAFQRLAPNMLSAAGYSGHGVALATLAGRAMAEAVRGMAARFDLLADLPQPRFPGGTALRRPLLVLAMSWYALRDRL